ncbi:uncharacterized protein EKO05_0002534 [Ascochyta rabiei]|uniref:uncharacterized protein n=1 Tax=Didymella rabiei TaxID=5454 RepID=UPI00220863A1|nr:uncharacterized protein EKO05_0002534 [Ascochyta rabiei]UPX11952.1 hypothetical protein EKO05_0002534 [Ascochyta rabiei]
MATFIDFSFAVDAARERRVRTERPAEAERVDAQIAAEEQCREQEAAFHRQGLNEPHRCNYSASWYFIMKLTGGAATLGTDKSLPPTPSATTFFAAPQAADIANTKAEQVPALPRLGRRQRAKEFFRPGLRKKRVAEEFAIMQLIAPEVEHSAEAPSLPGAGLLELRVREEKPLYISPIEEEFDADVTRAGDDGEITALPSLPGHRCRVRACPWRFQEQLDEPSAEDLADYAMDEDEAAYDAPGNRHRSNQDIIDLIRRGHRAATQDRGSPRQVPGLPCPARIPR